MNKYEKKLTNEIEGFDFKVEMPWKDLEVYVNDEYLLTFKLDEKRIMDTSDEEKLIYIEESSIELSELVENKLKELKCL